MARLSAETIFAIDFNLPWVPAALGLDVSPEAAAAILGVTKEEFLAYTLEAQNEVKRTAIELLAKPEVNRAVDRLPIPSGSLVMAVGDSITTYRYSYMRLLEALVALRRPDEEIRFLNVAQSGYTSTHGLENVYTQFLVHQPDVVFIKFGVNDCKIFGSPEAKTLVSFAEYQTNMIAMVEAFLTNTAAQVVLLTPAPVIEAIVKDNPDFKAMRMSWRGADLQARAEFLHELAARLDLLLVDLMELFGHSPDPSLYLPDGLHPGPRGQVLILEALLRTLTIERNNA